MPLNLIGPCQLHVPHKDQPDDTQLKQNWEAIEQWSYRLPGCFEGGQLVGSQIINDNTVRQLQGNNSPRHIWDQVYPHSSFGSGLNFVHTDNPLPNGGTGAVTIMSSGLLSWDIDVSYNGPGSAGATLNPGSSIQTSVRSTYAPQRFWIDTRPLKQYGEEFHLSQTQFFPLLAGQGSNYLFEVYVQQSNSVGYVEDFYVTDTWSLLNVPVPPGMGP